MILVDLQLLKEKFNIIKFKYFTILEADSLQTGDKIHFTWDSNG